MSAAPGPRWPRSVLVLAWVLSCGIYAGITTVVFHSFILTAFDNAIIEQVVARLSHFSAPITEVEGHGVNYFGDHFSPVLVLYAPFYRLVPEPETLFAVQGGVLALSVVVIMVTATRHLGRSAGLVVTVLYALSFGLLNTTVMSARETPFAVLLLALAGTCYLEKSVGGVVLSSLGLLFVKEDLGLTVAAIGFVLTFEARSRRAGVVLMVTGVAAFLLVMAVVLPAFRGGGPSPYASSPEDMFTATFGGWEIKSVTLFLTFGAAGFVAVRNRWSWVTLPTLAWRFTAPNMAYWTPLAHYSAALMPIVFLAAIAVLRDSPARQRRGALAIASVVTALTLTWAVQLAVSVYDFYKLDRQESALKALQSIPAGASVASDDHLIGHLAGDRTTYYMPDFSFCSRAEFVVAHIGPPEPNIWGGRADFYDFDDVSDLIRFSDDAYGGSHEIVSVDDNYAVIRRVDSGHTAPCVPADAGSDLSLGRIVRIHEIAGNARSERSPRG